MLLTRAPLDHSCITTQVIPCDLHVLNTPPAFVLSQNQTLRKNDLIFLQDVAILKILNRDCRPLGPAPRASKKRAAHNSIFFLFPACFGFAEPILECFHLNLGTSRAGPHCQRTSIEGTKKPIGCFASLRHRDRHPVSRPPSFVAAREARWHPPHPSTHFVIFFRFFHYPRNCLQLSGFFDHDSRFLSNPMFFGKLQKHFREAWRDFSSWKNRDSCG